MLKPIFSNTSVITIDGPAGAGKSSVAKLVALQLGFKYLDTGATYRAVTYYMLKNNIDLDNEKDVLCALANINVSFGNGKEVLLNGCDVASEIRSKNVVDNVSKVSAMKIVREKMVCLQRSIAGNDNYVVDGRDTGSVVFKDSKYKFYLDASVDERVKRRFLEETSKGNSTFTILSLKESIIARDEYDRTRKESPLVIPEGACIIDTTSMTIDEVVEKITNVVLNK